jgi:hypothetical protein
LHLLLHDFEGISEKVRTELGDAGPSKVDKVVVQGSARL